MNSNVVSVLHCLDKAQTEAQPFRHWLLADVLAEGTCQDVRDLPIDPPRITSHGGKRETHNETRYFFNRAACARFDVCRDVVETFMDEGVVEKLEATCGVELSGAHLRIEYFQDTDGMWLEPHTDIREKLFTMLVYLSQEPELADAGTDIFDHELHYVKTAPYKPNHGLIFIPGADTWHGFSKRPIRGVRRGLIVNYVTDDWRDRWQLV